VKEPFGLEPGQQWRGARLPSILVVPACSTTIIDQPSSVGRMHPLEAVKYRDQRTHDIFTRLRQGRG
jgi:hypothetical protein